MTLTSWYYAIITLADAYTPVKISLPVLRLVFCSLPRPSQPEYRHGKVLAPRLVADTEYVMDNVQSSEDELLRQHLPDLSDKMFPLDQKKLLNFRDGTHTEALLMDFVAQACKFREGQYYEIFMPCHSLRIIGIPIQHTMCYCCNFLGSILSNNQRHIEALGASISDPMRFSHAFPGHLHPWTPPRLLSNSAALDAAYGALCQLFAEVMRAYYGDRTPTATPYTDLRSLCLRLGETSSFPR
ncbi:hypothetical protein BDZ89DRAFT_206129 [Hymenopellis radicata]|nr:hypothetical protein BDZ89DRAFT_206129 [Hymenopellis radicata]